MAHFEQDRDYVDMEGNLRTFTIRDYSDAGRNRQKAIINEEAAKEADDNYNKSLKESIDSLCEEVPAVFAREIDEVVIVKDERIEWDKDALFIALKHYNSCYSCRQEYIIKKLYSLYRRQQL